MIDNKYSVSWESMCNFLEQNWGLIVMICRSYKLNPNDTVHHQEDAFMEAVKSYDPDKPARNKKYSLANHFGNLFRSKLQQEINHTNKMVYLEDIALVGDEDNGGDGCLIASMRVDITGRKQWRQNGSEQSFTENYRNLIEVLKRQGNGKCKKVFNHILMDDYEKAVEALPECKTEIMALINIKNGRKNGKWKG